MSYVGALFASLGYAIQLNQSNSFGEPLLRHIVTLKLAYRLPWQLYATLKAQLMVTRYFDPLLLDQRIALANLTFTSFEDENPATRSSSTSEARDPARRGLSDQRDPLLVLHEPAGRHLEPIPAPCGLPRVDLPVLDEVRRCRGVADGL